MIKNGVFFISLFAGLLLCAALLSAIPMYTNGALGKLLTKDLQSYQQTNNKYPGTLTITYNPNDDAFNRAIGNAELSNSILSDPKVSSLLAEHSNLTAKLQKYVKNLQSKFPIGVTASYANYMLSPRKITGSSYSSSLDTACSLQSMTDLDNHIKLLDGRLPQKTTNGVYEVLVTDNALSSMQIVLGQTYTLTDYKSNEYTPIRVKPVGTFTVKSGEDTYWSFTTPDNLDSSMMLDESVMLKNFINVKITQIYMAQWYYALKYQSLTLNNADTYLNTVSSINNDLYNITPDAEMSAPTQSLIENYYGRKQQLTGMMWALDVPVIVMLCLYLFMVSALVIRREENEIIMLSSRGARRFQIVVGYLIEGVLLGVLAMMIGPLLGYILCRMLGASSEFMQFVNRKGLPLRIGSESFVYALLAVAAFLVTLLVPAYRTCAVSIVEHKRTIARKNSSPWWLNISCAAVLLLVSGYGYYVYSQRQAMLNNTNVSSTAVSIDPLLFFIPVVFIFGMSFLFLFAYPYLVELITFVFRKKFHPPLYLAMTQVSRSTSNYSFIMIFLILTLSIGTFSASSARTINQNAEDKINYSNGADMVIQTDWASQTVTDSNSGTSRVVYYEPDYRTYQKIDGVQNTAKVLNKDGLNVQYKNKNISDVSLMGIESYDFGQVTWYRNGLLPYNINYYLNLLTSEQTSCLISTSMSKAYGLKVGSSFTVDWDNGASVVLNVYGIVDYWPTWNPNATESSTSTSANDNGDSGGNGNGNGFGGHGNVSDNSDANTTVTQEQMMIVANLDYIQNNVGIEPYSVWMKLKPGATSEEVYQSMIQNDIYPVSLADSKQQVINLKNDPFQLAINGSLTMGFLICGLVCLIGFMLFWVLSLRGRTLQFGVVRAMGLSSGQLKRMILYEQLLVSGVAIVVGIIVGFLTSALFIPFFQMSFNSSAQVPPFRVIADPMDLLRVFIAVGITLVVSCVVLIVMISKLKLNSIIKLGED
jgi:putative ABC transport system permease protein